MSNENNSSTGLDRASGYSHSVNSRDSKHNPNHHVSIITPKLKLDPELLAKNLQKVSQHHNASIMQYQASEGIKSAEGSTTSRKANHQVTFSNVTNIRKENGNSVPDSS